jgi:hypothetical protein
MNVEQALIELLVGKGWDAYASVPNPTPTTNFVTVERTGGGTRDKVDHPAITVQCWADTRKEAAGMADAVRCDLESLTGTGGFGAVTVESIYHWPDLQSRKARYQLTVDATAHV